MLSAAYCYSTRFLHSNIQHVSVSLLKLTRQVLILALQVQNLTQHPTFSTSVFLRVLVPNKYYKSSLLLLLLLLKKLDVSRAESSWWFIEVLLGLVCMRV